MKTKTARSKKSGRNSKSTSKKKSKSGWQDNEGYAFLPEKLEALQAIAESYHKNDLLEPVVYKMLAKIENSSREMTTGQRAAIRATYDKLAYFGYLKPLGQLELYLNEEPHLYG